MVCLHIDPRATALRKREILRGNRAAVPADDAWGVAAGGGYNFTMASEGRISWPGMSSHDAFASEPRLWDWLFPDLIELHQASDTWVRLADAPPSARLNRLSTDLMDRSVSSTVGMRRHG